MTQTRPLTLLALDTSTDMISVAVTRPAQGGAPIWQHAGTGGAQASTTLIPSIESLMAQAGLRYAELDAIAFGQGPGSFTGLRTACSVAQGLAFGAGIQLLPIDTLLAVAEEARHQFADTQSSLSVMALLDARMDEMYQAHYEFNSGQWHQRKGCRLISPEALMQKGPQELEGVEGVAGNIFTVYGERLKIPAAMPCWRVLPTAAAMLRLAPALLASGRALAPELALPLYIRDKVAKTTQEREAEKAR